MRTVLLCHTTREGRHFDWLIEAMPTCGLHAPFATPVSESPAPGLIWTARTSLASRDWANAGVFHLTVIQPHRPLYLTYQGKVSNNRGTVMRADEGTARVALCSASRVVLDIAMREFAGRVQLTRLWGVRWRGQVLPAG